MHQPDVWLTAARELPAVVADVREWIGARGHDEVWFCGAGTSAFIGESLSAYLNERRTPARYRAVPTTELVAHPQGLLRPGMRRLLVSFGRSGESPETLATLALLDRADADGLHVTCNADGALARSAGPRQRALVLPPETHDAGFAMTSSYSTMLLYALACFDDLPIAGIARGCGRSPPPGMACWLRPAALRRSCRHRSGWHSSAAASSAARRAKARSRCWNSPPGGWRHSGTRRSDFGMAPNLW